MNTTETEATIIEETIVPETDSQPPVEKNHVSKWIILGIFIIGGITLFFTKDIIFGSAWERQMYKYADEYDSVATILDEKFTQISLDNLDDPQSIKITEEMFISIQKEHENLSEITNRTLNFLKNESEVASLSANEQKAHEKYLACFEGVKTGIHLSGESIDNMVTYLKAADSLQAMSAVLKTVGDDWPTYLDTDEETIVKLSIEKEKITQVIQHLQNTHELIPLEEIAKQISFFSASSKGIEKMITAFQNQDTGLLLEAADNIEKANEAFTIEIDRNFLIDWLEINVLGPREQSNLELANTEGFCNEAYELSKPIFRL